MSYVISTIQSPSCISGVATANIGFDALILSRENELLISSVSDESVEQPQIFPIFGNIKSICTFDANKLVIILESETMICFEIIPSQLNTLFRCKPDYQIGEKLPKYFLSASNTLIVWHTRKRTFQIYNHKTNTSFMQCLPFLEVFSITCFDNEFRFVVLGKNVENSYQITFYKTNENSVDVIKSISLNGCESTPYLLAVNIDLIYVSYGNIVKTVKNKDKMNNYYAHQFKIHSLFHFADNSIGIYDEKGQIFDISNPNTLLLKLNDVDEIFAISHNYFFTTSTNSDAHLLKFENPIMKIVNIFAQINSARFMNRSQIITTNGRLRTFANGSATETKVLIPIKGGTHVWSVLNFIVVSTFDSTFFFNKKSFSEVDIDLERNSESLLVFAPTDDWIVQILTDRILLRTTEVQEIHFDENTEASQAAYYHDMFVVSFSNKTISLYKFIHDDSSIQCFNSFEVPFEVRSIDLNELFFALSFWAKATIMIYNIETLELQYELPVENEDETLISSLLFTDNGLIASSGDGDAYIFQFESNQFMQRTKLHVSSSDVKLRKINNRIFFVSDVSGFLCDNNEIEYISAPAAIDASYINNKIAILSTDNLSLMIIECSYHTHIEEEYAVSKKNLLDSSNTNNKIELIAVDEKNQCPVVYAVKVESQTTNASIYYLKASGCSDVKLSVQKPKCMTWFYYISDYYLVVGCENEKKGELILYNAKLEKLSSSYLDLPVDAICSVFNTYIAVASGTFLKEYIIDEDKKLQFKCSASTRVKCASLTSPNSFAVIYADKASSVSIYMMDDNITLIARDHHPKKLKFARMESKNDVLAIGDNSILYNIALTDDNKLITDSAININCQISAIFSSPDLAFITKGGSLKVLMKRDEVFQKLFREMQHRIRGIGGLSILESCVVRKNKNQFNLGKFVDGDFVALFRELNPTLQQQIAKAIGLDVDAINEQIVKYIDDVKAYREKSQNHPYFYS